MRSSTPVFLNADTAESAKNDTVPSALPAHAVRLSRRSFVAGGTATLVAAKTHPLHAATTWDLIVIGGGTAGLPAAIFAARRGARVLVLDSASSLGGTVQIAFGQICGAGTKTQARFGEFNDHPDIHFDDVMRLSNGHADPTVVRLTADHAAEMIDWLDDRGWECRDDHFLTGLNDGREHYSVRRYYQAVGEGKAIADVLLAEIAKDIAAGTVSVRLDTRVSELLTADNGRVEGVRATSNGTEFTARGRHVMVATGGYVKNPDLFQRLTNQPLYTGSIYEFGNGDGLALASSVGAKLQGAHLYRPGSGSILTGYDFPAKVYARFNTQPHIRPPWEIWVNDHGERYVNEETPDPGDREQELVKQPRLRYAIVFDDEIFNNAPPGIPDWPRDKMAKHFNSHLMFHKADSIEDLAAKADLHPENLAGTIAAYNAAQQSGTADPLGRQHRPAPIAKPPYYAIIQLGHSASSAVGVKVNDQVQAVTPSGEPIKGLYAAGEVLGSGATMGNAFVPGMMLTPSMVLGRQIGLNLNI